MSCRTGPLTSSRVKEEGSPELDVQEILTVLPAWMVPVGTFSVRAVARGTSAARRLALANMTRGRGNGIWA